MWIVPHRGFVGWYRRSDHDVLWRTFLRHGMDVLHSLQLTSLAGRCPDSTRFDIQLTMTTKNIGVYALLCGAAPGHFADSGRDGVHGRLRARPSTRQGDSNSGSIDRSGDPVVGDGGLVMGGVLRVCCAPKSAGSAWVPAFNAVDTAPACVEADHTTHTSIFTRHAAVKLLLFSSPRDSLAVRVQHAFVVSGRLTHDGIRT